METKTILYIILIFMFFCYGIMFIGIINQTVLQPATYSVIAACEPKEVAEPIFKANSVYTIGTTTGNLMNGTVQNITITINNQETNAPKQNDEILKHELCHASQFKRGDIPLCNNRAHVFNLEVECYLTQYEPDWYYNWRYG